MSKDDAWCECCGWRGSSDAHDPECGLFLARAEIARLTAELGAARAVPADVEAAIAKVCTDHGSKICDCMVAQDFATLRAAIARAISDARRESADRARRDAARAAEACAADGKALGYSADYLAGVERVIVRLRAMEQNGGPLTSKCDATATPSTVGGLLATARCSKCRGVSSHTPGGIPCDECGLVGSMPWGG